MSELRVVNIVGSGAFGQELDLAQLSNSLGNVAEYEPEIYPAMYLRLFGDDGPLSTIYRTGKFIVVGVDTEEELHEIKKRTTDKLNELIGNKLEVNWFDVQNIVYKGNIGKELDLNALTVDLGLTNTEFEPEQFPGLIYRSNSHGCVVLVFRSGNVIVTGTSSKTDAEAAYNYISDQIEELFNN
jgi:transcription initiation factor TFIID TATA-box-binding protein